jgi:hypothetical protein
MCLSPRFEAGGIREANVSSVCDQNIKEDNSLRAETQFTEFGGMAPVGFTLKSPSSSRLNKFKQKI